MGHFMDGIGRSAIEELVRDIPGLRSLEFINAYVHDFFQPSLLGKDEGLIGGLSPKFSEIILLDRM